MFCSHCSAEVFSTAANFCYPCGKELQRQRSEDKQSGKPLNDLITEMFHRGYPYDVIVSLLEKQGHKMHLRTLKRKLSDLRLRRKGNNFEKSEIELLILQKRSSDRTENRKCANDTNRRSRVGYSQRHFALKDILVRSKL